MIDSACRFPADRVQPGGRVAERDAGRQVERDRDRLQLADMVDRGRADAALDGRERRQRHQRAGAGPDIDVGQGGFVLLGLGCHLHDDLVAVAGR